MPARKRVSAKLIARCKFDYEETPTPVSVICARMGMSRSSFHARVRAWKWKRRRYSTAVVADSEGRSPTATAFVEATPSGMPDELAPVTTATMETLYARTIRAVGWEMDRLEGVLKALGPGQQEAQSERTSRVIATVNKTILEIAALAKPDPTTAGHEADDDTVPNDIDAFREELARRIRGLVDAERRRAGEGSDGTGTERAAT